jgi:hypothetical protein
MGQLMALALLCTMMAAVLFQPALMGPPRKVTRDEPMRVPAEPEATPAAAAWAVERIAAPEANPSARSVRVGEKREKQGVPHELEP